VSLIIAENITHAYTDAAVLKDVSFRISEADRIGLVGPNAEGKTTLLRIIGGMLEPTGGTVHRRRGLRVGYLPQDSATIEGSTIREKMLEVFDDVCRLQRQMHELADEMAHAQHNAELLKRYGRLQAQFEARGGHDYIMRVERILTGLGFDRSTWDRPLKTLSGGQRTRVCLARLLLQEHDLLLLDEPTNHLELESVEWLEDYLCSFRGALVVVSHDRYFLDRVTDNTWEIAFASLQTYRGSYSRSRKQREDRLKERMRQWQAQQEYVRRTREFIDRNIAGQRGNQAQGRRTRLQRFLREEAIDRPREQKTISLKLTDPARTGDLALTAENLAVGYDPSAPLLTAERLEVQRGRKIAVIGANGAGKTTLLRTLLGQVQPLAGTVRYGANVRVSYLSQTHAELDEQTTALDAVLAADRKCATERARTILGSLLITGDDVYKKIGELSGGQRSRVVLARLIVQAGNLLVLDEPTNHLDIPSTEILQQVLKDFDGTVLLVTHDRYLVQAAATDIWAIEAGTIQCIPGAWDDYLQWRDRRHRQTQAAKAADHDKEQRKLRYRQARQQTNLINRLKRRLEQIETDIEAAEKELARLNDAISDAGQASQVQQVEQLGREFEQKNRHLKALWNEWEQVGERLSSLTTDT